MTKNSLTYDATYRRYDTSTKKWTDFQNQTTIKRMNNKLLRNYEMSSRTKYVGRITPENEFLIIVFNKEIKYNMVGEISTTMNPRGLSMGGFNFDQGTFSITSTNVRDIYKFFGEKYNRGRKLIEEVFYIDLRRLFEKDGIILYF